MASGGPPDTLNARHRLIAMLHAAGATGPEIAEKVGMSLGRVTVIKSSPLFQLAVREYQDALLRQLADVTQRLHAEAMPTLEKLVTLRDHGEEQSTQLGAANSLADRIPALAKKVRTEDDRTMRILFGHEVEAVLEAMAEEKGERYIRRDPAALAETAAVRPVSITAVPLDDLLDNWVEPEAIPA